MLTSTGWPVPSSTRIFSPRQSRRTCSMWRNMISLRSAYAVGASTKSLTCHPDAKETPIRPCESVSTSAHSSATRNGLWSGTTTLPARICTRSVTPARAAPVIDGLG